MSGDIHAQSGAEQAACQQSTAFEYVLCQLLHCGAGNAAKERVPEPMKPFQQKCNWSAAKSAKYLLIL